MYLGCMFQDVKEQQVQRSEGKLHTMCLRNWGNQSGILILGMWTLRSLLHSPNLAGS